MKRIGIIILITSVLTFGVLYGSYLLVLNGDAYAFASSYIKRNSEITNSLGPIQSTRLHYSGYSVIYHNVEASGKFMITVTGERAQAVVYLELERKQGVWEVIKGRLINSDNRFLELSK